MYNNNPDFDYGAFRQLQFYVRETNISMSVFLHVFTDPGTYVFVDAQDAARLVLSSLGSLGWMGHGYVL